VIRQNVMAFLAPEERHNASKLDRGCIHTRRVQQGCLFHARDLPADAGERDRIILDVLGSSDPYGRQLNGMGGGISSVSKVVIVGPPTHPDADVDYTFEQVAVDRPLVDYAENCGNLSSAVGPFAIDEGLVTGDDGDAVLVRLYNTNTKKNVHARFAVRGGMPEVAGDFAIAGVAGTGAKIRFDFLSPRGAVACDLLPTGNVTDMLHVEGLGPFRVSCVDATVPVAYVAGRDVGLDGSESPDDIEAKPGLMELLERLRRAAAGMMGLAKSPPDVALGVPKVAMVCSPAPFKILSDETVPADTHDVAIRILSMGRVHRTVTLTGAMCLATACRVDGTIPNEMVRQAALENKDIRVANPSGVISVGADVSRAGNGWTAGAAVVYRTQRRLMQGQVAYRNR
jgi:2-methylaconitate cis-trans-isomerase PrpF